MNKETRRCPFYEGKNKVLGREHIKCVCAERNRFEMPHGVQLERFQERYCLDQQGGYRHCYRYPDGSTK